MNKAHYTGLAGLLGLLLSTGVCADESYARLSIHTHVLAASCAACHGTNGNSVGGTPVLAGLNADHFIRQMQAFRSGERASTVMHRHAKGLTDTEIRELADHFSRQPRVNTELPPPARVKP
ncbi:MAG TPA: c-type cytochrome [Methylophilaceae bacterium]|jgi:sulfide dehydrogenase cytochrome subunit